MMLGSPRQTVNVVASALQKDDIISDAYGRVNVLDRTRLEQRACECYRTVEDVFAQHEVARDSHLVPLFSTSTARLSRDLTKRGRR